MTITKVQARRVALAVVDAYNKGNWGRPGTEALIGLYGVVDAVLDRKGYVNSPINFKRVMDNLVAQIRLTDG